MDGVQSRDFDSPDETRTGQDAGGCRTHERDHRRAVRFRAGVAVVGMIKPVVGTASCHVRHVGVVHSGRMAVTHEDGTEVEIGAGEAYIIEPGHDAWVVGDEPFVGFEFESRSAEEYAKG
jgi:uncharacterized cupin superfamily protein